MIIFCILRSEYQWRSAIKTYTKKIVWKGTICIWKQNSHWGNEDSHWHEWKLLLSREQWTDRVIQCTVYFHFQQIMIQLEPKLIHLSTGIKIAFSLFLAFAWTGYLKKVWTEIPNINQLWTSNCWWVVKTFLVIFAKKNHVLFYLFETLRLSVSLHHTISSK